MERILLFIDFEIESCENKIDEESNEIIKAGLKERLRAFREVKHRLESELDHNNGMPQLRAFGAIPINGMISDIKNEVYLKRKAERYNYVHDLIYSVDFGEGIIYK